MSEQASWPPPPTVPSPLAAHDAFLTACVLNAPARWIITRPRLAGKLRKERGIDGRQSLAIVNDYCDRYAILPSAAHVELWVRSLVGLIGLAVLTTLVLLRPTEKEFAAATTHAAVEALITKSDNVIHVALGLCAIMFCIVIPFSWWRIRRAHRNTEAARNTLTATATAQP